MGEKIRSSLIFALLIILLLISWTILVIETEAVENTTTVEQSECRQMCGLCFDIHCKDN